MARLTSIKPRVAGLPGRVGYMPKVAAGIYQSRQWRELVASIKRLRGNRCEVCGSSHRVAGDHVIELKDGGEPFDPRNVQLLCHAHHQAKTAEARRARAGGL